LGNIEFYLLALGLIFFLWLSWSIINFFKKINDTESHFYKKLYVRAPLVKSFLKFFIPLVLVYFIVQIIVIIWRLFLLIVA